MQTKNGDKMTNYFITGITGLIGSLIMKKIIQSEEYAEGNVRITALVRNTIKFQEMYKDYDCSSVMLLEGELSENLTDKAALNSIDYMIHCASATTSSYMISNPVETADSIVMGTHNILELARQRKIKSMVYLSSMEVYGKVPDIGRPRREEELGEIQLDNARSCYSLGKRMAEHYCYIYAQEYGIPVKIARLAQTFGTGARPEDNRVYMQFARSVAEKRDIVLRTEGLSMGNYCATEDAINAIFTILYKGADGEAYNVVNEANTMCIRDMAQLVAKQVAGGSIKVKIELEDSNKTGYAPDTGLRLSGEKLGKLGWQPTKNLVEMYKDVVREVSRVCC